MISFDDFKKLDLRVGRVLAAERVEGSEKLLKLTVDIGGSPSSAEGGPGTITLVAGVGLVYSPEDMANRNIVIVANLEPRVLMGLESQGMLLAADSEGGPVLLMPDREVPPGAGIR